MIDARDQFRVGFDVHVKADMQFHARRRSGGKLRRYLAFRVVNRAGHDNGSPALYVGADKGRCV